MLEKERLDTEQVALGLLYNINKDLLVLCDSVFDQYFMKIPSST
jgi:hypothetical protein